MAAVSVTHAKPCAYDETPILCHFDGFWTGLEHVFTHSLSKTGIEMARNHQNGK